MFALQLFTTRNSSHSHLNFIKVMWLLKQLNNYLNINGIFHHIFCLPFLIKLHIFTTVSLCKFYIMIKKALRHICN